MRSSVLVPGANELGDAQNLMGSGCRSAWKKGPEGRLILSFESFGDGHAWNCPHHVHSIEVVGVSDMPGG